MCHASCVIFGATNISKEDIAGKSVIDIGSHDYNGNFYPLFKHYGPKEFIGTDMIAGPGVDVVCMAEDIVQKFGENRFDTVLSSELMEHARDWRTVISNIKRVCKLGGIIALTTRSYGCAYHAFPYDFWRYEIDDMKEIFSDCEILALESDHQVPGVFIKVKKPLDFKERDLSAIALYSMIDEKRVVAIDTEREKKFYAAGEKRDRWLGRYKAFEKSLFRLGHRILFPGKA